MIGRTELRFSAARLERAETRLTHQRSVVDNLRWGDDPQFATLAEDTLDLMERRAFALHENHQILMAKSSEGRADSDVDERWAEARVPPTG